MKSCNSCGKCCIKYGNRQLSAATADLEIWHALRPDIAAFVFGDSIWFDSETGQHMEYCPWLRKESDTLYTCAIYLDRPEDCRVYPANLADMINDECEMLELGDLSNLKQAQRDLDLIKLTSE